MFLRTFFTSIAITAVTLAVAAWLGGPTALLLVAVLIVLEVSLSFDNAVINAGVLLRMSRFWQKIFLTVGVAIAVFGMRLAFPLLLVTFNSDLGPIEAFRLALDRPAEYQATLEAAHPAIAAFGGIFLLMIFLDYMFEGRELYWLRPIESVLAKIGKLQHLSSVISLAVLVVAADLLAKEPAVVLTSGLAGLLTYLLVKGLGDLFESAGDDTTIEPMSGDPESVPLDGPVERPAPGTPIVVVVGRAAFFLFLYLEVLDASFSFDGVVGAFAISSNIFIIAAGLGVGALYVRSITVYLVRKGTLSEYVYLEHGAHWAIGALAVIMMLTIQFHINEIITGLIGLVFIIAAVISSLIRNRRATVVTESAPERELARS